MIFVLLRGMSDTAVTLSSEWVRFPKAYQISKSLSDFPKHIRFPKAYQISKILSDFSEVGYHGKKTIGVWWEISNTYQKVLAITLQISALSLAVKIRHNLLNHYTKQFWLSFALSTIFLICLQMIIILMTCWPGRRQRACHPATGSWRCRGRTATRWCWVQRWPWTGHLREEVYFTKKSWLVNFAKQLWVTWEAYDT